MKTFNYSMVIPIALAIFLSSIGVAYSQNREIEPGFEPDPLVLTGTSGGSQASKNCGMIGATPNHVINLGQKFNYLRFIVQSAGQPTLFIEGPNGSTCVQGLPGQNIEDSGLWVEGQYSIYVGDRAGGQNAYTLSITTQKNSQ